MPSCIHGIYRVAKMVDPGAIPFNIPVFPLLPRLAIKTYLPHRISPVDPSLAALCVQVPHFILVDASLSTSYTAQ